MTMFANSAFVSDVQTVCYGLRAMAATGSKQAAVRAPAGVAPMRQGAKRLTGVDD